MTLKIMQSLKKNWFLVPKMTWWIWWNLMRAVSNLEICTLMCSFFRKDIMFEWKKYIGVMCHNTKERCKICGWTDLCFEKWLEEFGKFWLNTLNTCTLMGSFWARYIIFELQNYEGVICHDTEGWCNV